METKTPSMIVIPRYEMRVFDQAIELFYRSPLSPTDMSNRIECAARFFLNKPYLFEALGEGEQGFYSQEPLYRTDRFDCVGYVDTVLSLASAKNLNEFKENIIRIRYHGGTINYTKRTDWFTDLEWIPHVRQLGWIHEAMPATTSTAETMIDKAQWYAAKQPTEIRLLNPLNAEEAQHRLQQLKKEGLNIPAQKSTLSFIPLTQLFDMHDKADLSWFDQIPSLAVIVIVRPNWPIKDYFQGRPQGYGTNLNVSHLGLSVRTKSGLMFYHASSLEQKVVKLPLADYLKAFLRHDTIKGIHVEKITLGG